MVSTPRNRRPILAARPRVLGGCAAVAVGRSVPDAVGRRTVGGASRAAGAVAEAFARSCSFRVSEHATGYAPQLRTNALCSAFCPDIFVSLFALFGLHFWLSTALCRLCLQETAFRLAIGNPTLFELLGLVGYGRRGGRCQDRGCSGEFVVLAEYRLAGGRDGNSTTEMFASRSQRYNGPKCRANWAASISGLRPVMQTLRAGRGVISYR